MLGILISLKQWEEIHTLETVLRYIQVHVFIYLFIYKFIFILFKVLAYVPQIIGFNILFIIHFAGNILLNQIVKLSEQIVLNLSKNV